MKPAYSLPLALILVLTGGLSGCGVVPDRTDRYQEAQREAPLRLPDFYRTERLGNRYPVGQAERAFVPVEAFRVPPPPDPGSELLMEQFALKTVGNEQWILVTEPVGRIWPALLDYWSDLGAEVAQNTGGPGQLRASLDNAGMNSRKLAESMGLSPDSPVVISATIQSGIKRNTAEIRVAVIEPAAEPVTDEPPPQARAVLQDLLNYLSSRRDSLESYSLVAQVLDADPRVRMVQEADEQAHIEMELAFDRAWAAVGQSLQESGAELVDLDRSAGDYYVSYGQDQEDEGGFWSGLFGDEESALLSDRYNYRVKVITEDSITRVSVIGTREDLPRNEHLKLLDKILENLS